MNAPSTQQRLSLFAPPYRELSPLASVGELAAEHGHSGAVIVWSMAPGYTPSLVEALRTRPPGIPLIGVLPPSGAVTRPAEVFRVVERCRPHSLLPFHAEPDPHDLRTLLRKTPGDLAGALVEYLGWRGLVVDLEMRRLIRRIIEMSSDLQTVSALARGLYISRRALGRRFMNEGLPVPSHWLHFGRVLRAAIRLQAPNANLMQVAFDLGYADGFCLSNQMNRLTGVRPTVAAQRLGWEWFVERWIATELSAGGFDAHQSARLVRRVPAPADPPGRGAEGLSAQRPDRQVTRPA